MARKRSRDHHVPRSITFGLRQRGIDVLTAFEDGAHAMLAPDLLDRASTLGRALFTRDDDLRVENQVIYLPL